VVGQHFLRGCLCVLILEGGVIGKLAGFEVRPDLAVAFTLVEFSPVLFKFLGIQHMFKVSQLVVLMSVLVISE
jgi:hypothetical protein